jgi:hypothetical protein
MRAAARQGTSGREARPVMLMLLAASPTIDLDQFGQGESEQLILVEVGALLAFAVADGFGGGFAQVPDGFGLQAA